MPLQNFWARTAPEELHLSGAIRMLHLPLVCCHIDEVYEFMFYFLT